MRMMINYRNIKKIFSQTVVNLCTTIGGSRDIDWQTDEYEVEKILGHRRRKDGKWEFKVKWKGCDISDASWEPLNHFFHRYSSAVVKYAKERGLTKELDVLEVLSAEHQD